MTDSKKDKLTYSLSEMTDKISNFNLEINSYFETAEKKLNLTQK